MDFEGASANRRPLKSRGTRWAAWVTRLALRSGITANGISLLGIAVSITGAAALLLGHRQPLALVFAALCIQLRLIANLVDGLVAIEGGRGSATGAIYNEFPDRIEDSLFLVAAGYVSGIPWLGWFAALLAAVCAYVRLLSATFGLPQDFGGPMAKQHRMATLTVACLAAAVEALLSRSNVVLELALAAIAAGTVLTIALRLGRMARTLNKR